jgi:DNA-binding NarL/FixJ family response regulator
MTTIRVLVADDQAIVRDGLAMLLGAAGLDVVAVAHNGREAVDLALELSPDVALLDLRMPELGGAEATAELARIAPQIKVLILTTFDDDAAVLPALRAGAVGYLTKDATGEALVAAIHDVAAGRTVLDSGIQQRLVQMLRAEPPAAPPPPQRELSEPPPSPSRPVDRADGLTRREVDVVRLIAQGLTNRQVARDLVVSEATVKTHLNHILAKLTMDGRSELIAWAWREGLGSP